jgi:hypothetical protein
MTIRRKVIPLYRVLLRDPRESDPRRIRGKLQARLRKTEGRRAASKPQFLPATGRLDAPLA